MEVNRTCSQDQKIRMRPKLASTCLLVEGDVFSRLDLGCQTLRMRLIYLVACPGRVGGTTHMARRFHFPKSPMLDDLSLFFTLTFTSQFSQSSSLEPSL